KGPISTSNPFPLAGSDFFRHLFTQLPWTGCPERVPSLHHVACCGASPIPSCSWRSDMTSVSVNPEAGLRSQGRGYFWLGLGVCLLGLVLAAGQLFGLKRLFVPWYAPALATIGAFLLLLAVMRRRTIPRVIALVLVAAFAGAEWYFLGSLIKLPD